MNTDAKAIPPTPANPPMSWTPLSFGKHEGRTLPQIALTDPEYLFWLLDEGILNRCCMADEGHRIEILARRIRIPQRGAERLEAEYVRHCGGRFGGMQIVPASRPAGLSCLRLPYIDLAAPRRMAGGMDREGGEWIAVQVRRLILPNRRRLTAKQAAAVFNDMDNFFLD